MKQLHNIKSYFSVNGFQTLIGFLKTVAVLVDEMGNLSIEFFIRYCPDMTYEEEKELYMDIIKDIRTFCNANNLLGEFLKISFFVTVAGDCRKSKKI